MVQTNTPAHSVNEPPQARLLFVAPDPKLREFSRRFAESYAVVCTECTSSELFSQHLVLQSDMVLLSLAEGGPDPSVLCALLRKRSIVPIVVFAPHGSNLETLVRVFEQGADDVIRAPLAFAEFAARVLALVARGRQRNDPQPKLVGAGDMFIDEEQHLVYVRGAVVVLSSASYRLLRYFLLNPDRTISRTELYKQVWGNHTLVYRATVDTAIQRLRKKIEDNPAQPRRLVTVFGVGYRFVATSG